jgi:hypothetical protein
MEFLAKFFTETWYIWVGISIFGWGSVFFVKCASREYLTHAESFGDSVARYGNLVIVSAFALMLAVVSPLVLVVSFLITW